MLFRKTIASIKERLEKLEKRMETNVESHINKMERVEIEYGKRLATLEENVRNSNNQIADFNAIQSQYIGRFEDFNAPIRKVEENIRNNNSEILINRKQMAEFSEQVTKINNKLAAYTKKLVKNMSEDSTKIDTEKESKINIKMEGNPYQSIDYFDFEDHFRGSREHIKEVQKEYLKYFVDKKNVVDLGCGRGEFLELLKENNIPAKGVDSYNEFVQYCLLNEMDVIQEDAIEYLRRHKNIDGIFAGQLIEHLTTDEIITLCNLAFEALSDKGVIVLETPNPTSLAIYTHAFYIDPSHTKPVHPLTMQYYLEKAGFSKIEILYTESSKLPMEIPTITGGGIENLLEFNESMKRVSDILFGSQDYAIIAYKQ